MQTIGIPIPRVARVALTCEEEAFRFGVGFSPRNEHIDDVRLSHKTLAAMRDAKAEGCTVIFTHLGDEVSSVYVFEIEEKGISFEPETWRRIGPRDESWSLHRQTPPDWAGTLEKGLADFWREQNDPERNSGINSGCGLAQDLMLSVAKYEKPENFEVWLTNRERSILATFVQWLGTNCGRCFLEQAFLRGGYPITFRSERSKQI